MKTCAGSTIEQKMTYLHCEAPNSLNKNIEQHGFLKNFKNVFIIPVLTKSISDTGRPALSHPDNLYIAHGCMFLKKYTI